MTFATDMRAMFDSLTGDLGNSVTFKDVTSETYDPATGENTRTTDDQDANVGGPFGYESRFVDGDLILESDRKIYLSAEGLSWAPEVDERVVHNTQTYVIVRVTEFEAQDTMIGWELQIR